MSEVCSSCGGAGGHFSNCPFGGKMQFAEPPKTITDEQIAEMYMASQKVNEQRRAERLQLAGMAMQGILANDVPHPNYSRELFAKECVDFADALLKRLEETEGK